MTQKYQVQNNQQFRKIYKSPGFVHKTKLLEVTDHKLKNTGVGHNLSLVNRCEC